MPQASLARSLRAALLGLSLVFATLAGFGVAALYDARQAYEDSLSRAYELQSAAAGLLAAGVVEEAVLRGRAGPGAAGVRARSARAHAEAARAAAVLARDDPPSARLVARAARAQREARRAAGRQRSVVFADPGDPLAAPFGVARRSAAGLSGRQATLRADARREARADSRRAAAAIAAGTGLALLAALALVAAITARVRRPLDDLVDATQRLAAGDLGLRVDPAGPAELRQLAEAFNVMSGDIASARARVEAQRERLEITVAALGDALLVTDGEGRVTAANPRAGELLPELPAGSRLADHPGELPPLGEALAGEVPFARGERALVATAAPLGADEGAVWTVRDVTERARLEDLKSEFVATASHELRSPLTSIKGFVELLGLSGGLSEKQRSYVEILRRSTERLVLLVDDLLDVARIEAEHVDLRLGPTDLRRIVGDLAEELAPRLLRKRQQLEVDLEGLPSALADPDRIRQVLGNLLTNAHLYTGPGGRLSVRGRAAGEQVEIEVSDTGKGMTEFEVEHVFERFYRGRSTAEAPGTGLGLAIVKSLVDLHAGTIEVESEPGRGTTFRLALPRAGEEAGPRVLAVVGPEARPALVSALSAAGVEADWVDSGMAAVRASRRRPYDVALVDAGMRDPRAVLRALEGSRELRAIVVRDARGRDGERSGLEAVAPDRAVAEVRAALRGDA